MSHSSQEKPDILFSRFTGASAASVGTIDKTESAAKLTDVEKRDEIRGNFLRVLPVTLGGAYGGGRCPQEYEGICWDGISY